MVKIEFFTRSIYTNAMKNPQLELLAPAGDADCFRAAIAAGADAIYFGLEQFNARKRATNLTLFSAEKLIKEAHRFACKAYLTLNTVLLDEELEDALLLVKDAINCGVDAVIVQDMGFLSILKCNFPQLEIHASTQMTTHNSAQCNLLANLGVKQINLSRELSLAEIARLTPILHAHNIVPEVFVHGAYCLSFSGECYFSCNLYGEAGNRGACVQPCRRTYQVDNPCPARSNCTTQKNSFAQNAFAPFHLKDNFAYPLAKELVKVGAQSFKIEGRIKNAQYVWAVTSAWRAQLDAILNGKNPAQNSKLLDCAINRAYSTHYLQGDISSEMFSSGTKDYSQQKIGTVKNYNAKTQTLSTNCINGVTLQKDDELTIKTKTGAFVCTATVIDVLGSSARIALTNKLQGKILPEQQVFRANYAISKQDLQAIIANIAKDEPNTKQSAPSCSSKNVQTQKMPLAIKVDGKLGTTLNAHFAIISNKNDEKNCSVTVHSLHKLELANANALDKSTMQQKFAKLGTSPFVLQTFDASAVDEGLFLPLADLNKMRQIATSKLIDKMAQRTPCKEIAPCDANATNAQSAPYKSTATKNATKNSYKIAFICSTINYAQILAQSTLQKDVIIVLEIPLLTNALFDLYKTFLQAHKNVVPLFGAILLDDALKNATQLLCALASTATTDNAIASNKRTVWCENTGLAHFASQKGFDVVLGACANATNSKSFSAYKDCIGVNAIVPSKEIAPKNIATLNTDCKIWYPLYEKSLHLASRQCVLHNAVQCTKKSVDNACIHSCNKNITLIGANKEKIDAIKREHFYSCLYQKEIISHTNDVAVLKNCVDVWTIDMRFIEENFFNAKNIQNFIERAKNLLINLYSAKSNLTQNAQTVECKELFSPVARQAHYICKQE